MEPKLRPLGYTSLRRSRALAGLVVLTLSLTACPIGREDHPSAPASVRGMLRVSAYGPASLSGGSPLRHVSEWVNGPDYQGMEDDDLRGFLDGRFVYGWNQPGQIHVRAGRRDTRPKWGETELFRTLIRWADVTLPADARVHAARLTIEIEDDPGRPLDVLIYAVQGDWDPGEGGEQRNNTSPPRKGEVWWGERAHDERPWGFPGAGYASDADPAADTPLMALAETHLEPGQGSLIFASPALDRYVEDRVQRGLPLLFLLKLSDALEDTPGTLLHLYSGNHGDLRNRARRPVLQIEWESPRQVARLERAIHLENGRRLLLPRLAAPGARLVACSFEPLASRESLTLEVRGGRGEATSEWQPATLPVAVDWDWVEVRALAARNPVVIGRAFESRFRDTWVRSAPPEEQRVAWEFVSPRGARHRVDARYAGDYTWEVAFEPLELGRWRYVWTQNFTRKPYRSAEGVFDVVAGEREDVARALRALLERIRRLDPPPSDEAVSDLAPPFWKLERAVFQIETPASLASGPGRELLELLTEVRRALSQRDVPERPEPVAMEREF